ncbi:MAG: hypothetical protein IPM01_25490 [Burkholderiaceae bacterium]|nr:hypothetical protein [Burkholderiaceae bacterium]
MFNDPRAVRDHNKKAHIASREFPSSTAPTSSFATHGGCAFVAEHGEAVFNCSTAWAARRSSVRAPAVPTCRSSSRPLNRFGAPPRTVMAQRYLPYASSTGGDKRVLLIGGEVVPVAWRASKTGGRAATLAASGTGRAQPPSACDLRSRREVACALGIRRAALRVRARR